MDKFIRCPKCGKRYAFCGPIEKVSLCPECLISEKNDFEAVRDYLVSNGGCDINQVSDATNVSTQKIFKYLREGKLGTIEDKRFLKSR